MRWTCLDRACRAFRSTAMLVADILRGDGGVSTTRRLWPGARLTAALVGGCGGGNIVAQW
jgi:hypothetical protein